MRQEAEGVGVVVVDRLQDATLKCPRKRIHMLLKLALSCGTNRRPGGTGWLHNHQRIANKNETSIPTGPGEAERHDALARPAATRGVDNNEGRQKEKGRKHAGKRYTPPGAPRAFA